MAADLTTNLGSLPKPLCDRRLEHGRISQSKPNEKFELFLSLFGKQIKLAELESEDEAIAFYTKALSILKPAVHNPFGSSAIGRGGDVEGSSISEDQVNKLAMFDDLSSFDTDIQTTDANNEEGGLEIDLRERRIALKTLAAPSEDSSTRRRKLISQKSLNTVNNKRMKGGISGGHRKSSSSDLKLDLFTDLDPALPYNSYIVDGSAGCQQTDKVPSNVMDRVCGLCGGGEQSMKGLIAKAWDTKTLNDELCRDYDGNGIWLRKPLQMQRGRPGAWIHWTCALYSPLTFLGSRHHISEEDLEALLASETQVTAEATKTDDNKMDIQETTVDASETSGVATETDTAAGAASSKEESVNSTYWFNVRKEVTRGRQLICTACNQRGATIGCMVEGCKSNLHIPCAVLQEQWRLPVPWLKDTSPFSCNKHSLASIAEASKNAKMTARALDVSGGIEKTAVTWSPYDSQKILPCGFVYAASPIYDVEVPIFGLPATELPNECLEHKKYYLDNRLILKDQDGPGELLTECGIGASCNMSCRGRLIYRGISKALEIYPTPLSSSSSSSPKSKLSKPYNYPTLNRKEDVCGWSVRAKHESLSVGDFVCEFIGRIAPADRNDIRKSLLENDRRVTLVSDWLPANYDPKSMLPVDNNSDSFKDIKPLVVDARQYGNVGRFIRKADREKGEVPNLFMQGIFTETHNPFAPRLALFAKIPIKEGSELLR